MSALHKRKRILSAKPSALKLEKPNMETSTFLDTYNMEF